MIRPMTRAGIFLLCLLVSTFALAKSPGEKIHPELQQLMTAKSGLSTDASRQDLFRVIINLDAGQFSDGRAVNDAFTSDSGNAALRAHINAAQDRVLSAMSADAVSRVGYRYGSVHAISAKLNADEIEQLTKHGDVVMIEPQPVFEKMFTEAHPLTNADQAHAAGHTGDGAVIAIIDDGIDHDHPAFGGSSSWPNSKILGGYDFADFDTNPRIDCLDQSHGTAVAGVATGNGGGVTGSAPDANFVFLKVQSSSECGQPSLSGDVAGAIDWAVTNRNTYGINIISMSLGGGTFTSTCDNSSTAYRNAINAAHSAGMIVLAASGNDGECNAMSRPACFTNVISVGAVYDATMSQTGFCVSSNACGNTQSHPTCAASGLVACFDNPNADLVTCYSNSASFLDILAPSNCATTAQTGGGTQSCFGGTSSATPYAAGVAATLIEANGGPMDNDEMRALLRDNGVNINDPRQNRNTPRVDVIASVDAIDGGGPGGGGPTVLSNGVPETGLSGSQGAELDFVLSVPAGASDLEFDISGGSGDADLYVRFGAAPTLNTYDCRPWLNGNNESCDFSSPSAGDYYVMVQGYTSFSGVTLVGSYSTQAPNDPPNASFSFSTSDLTASFNDNSSDPDGSIASRSWNFGDGNGSSSTNPSHTYSSGGTYTVTLTVTDDDGATDSTSSQVTVTEPAGGSPCTGGSSCEEYSGNLSGTGDWDAQPNGTYFYSSSGTHEGWLEGPGSADFDLRLYRWQGGSWQIVDSSTSASSSEYVSYNGGSGYYYWRILSYSGSGNYDFWMVRP